MDLEPEQEREPFNDLAEAIRWLKIIVNSPSEKGKIQQVASAVGVVLCFAGVKNFLVSDALRLLGHDYPGPLTLKQLFVAAQAEIDLEEKVADQPLKRGAKTRIFERHAKIWALTKDDPSYGSEQFRHAFDAWQKTTRSVKKGS